MLFITDFKAAQNRSKDHKILKSRQKHVTETVLKAFEKPKNCLTLNVDTHLYYETRSLLILQGNQFFAEYFYVAHLFFDNLFKFILPILFRNHFFQVAQPSQTRRLQ